MDENQRKAIQKLRPLLIDKLQIDEVILQLRAQDILTAYSVEILEKIVDRSERCQQFLEIIMNLDNAWEPFLNALDHTNQHYLRIELETEVSGISIVQKDFQKLQQQLVPQLENYISKETEHIRRFWKDYLEVDDLSTSYQPLEIVEIREQKNKKETIEGYQFIWENQDIHFFVIEGDPGVGKTTWMNKLATDWTNKNEVIRQKFDLLFLIPLRYLETATFDSLLEYLCCIFHRKIDITQIQNCLKHPRTLLLLDGFDENPSCIEFIQTFTVKNGYYSKVLITCRSSHFDQIRNSEICDMRLLVNGFKNEVINQFFELQNCKKTDKVFASNSQLPEMCKVPVIAAIFFGICKHNDKSKIIAEDENCSLFIIFENFVQMLIEIASKKRPNVFHKSKNAIQAVGNLALDTEQIIVFYSDLVKKDQDVEKLYKSVPKNRWKAGKKLQKLLRIFHLKGKNNYLELASDIGLICKRSQKHLNVGNDFCYDFYHQLILEYFAAFQFNQILIEMENRNQIQEWFSNNYRSLDKKGPFYYFLRSFNHQLFEFIVKNSNYIHQAAHCLNDYSKILLSNQNYELIFWNWTLTGKSASHFITAAITCHKKLEFCDCKIDSITDLKHINRNSATTKIVFSNCKIDTNSLDYLLSIPTLESVEFNFKSIVISDIENISKLKFSDYRFNKLIWYIQSNYDVFETLLSNKNLQQNLQYLMFFYPHLEDKFKFHFQLIQTLYGLKKLNIRWFKCSGTNDCPSFFDKDNENFDSLKLTEIEFRAGKICQHILEFLKKLQNSLQEIQFDRTGYENETVESNLKQLKNAKFIFC